MSPVSGLDNKGATMRALLVVLVLALRSSALPLLSPTADTDNWLLAEVGLQLEWKTFKYMFLYMTILI